MMAAAKTHINAISSKLRVLTTGRNPLKLLYCLHKMRNEIILFLRVM